eukprot:CAMPEP_0183532608 /NCGR_PEP_ID=MMETSP0371-20130417/25642_2 /TAXON_ID=268820 /ORGANISM="Peridinium aciculiferum, Strain PAER-2" /LENGTH=126 /DNA_ID=CAMNT_0025732757 /DNA_START=177 /DNA_END=557 /DNA_ORIENTATION=-
MVTEIGIIGTQAWKLTSKTPATSTLSLASTKRSLYSHSSTGSEATFVCRPSSLCRRSAMQRERASHSKCNEHHCKTKCDPVEYKLNSRSLSHGIMATSMFEVNTKVFALTRMWRHGGNDDSIKLVT